MHKRQQEIWKNNCEMLHSGFERKSVLHWMMKPRVNHSRFRPAASQKRLPNQNSPAASHGWVFSGISLVWFGTSYLPDETVDGALYHRPLVVILTRLGAFRLSFFSIEQRFNSHVKKWLDEWFASFLGNENNVPLALAIILKVKFVFFLFNVSNWKTPLFHRYTLRYIEISSNFFSSTSERLCRIQCS